MGGLFSFPLKIHFKGRQLPAGRGFFKISFALVIRATGFWQPAGQRIFPFTPYNTSKGKNDGNSGNFLFASYYGQKSKMPNAGAEKFSPHLLLQSEQGEMAGSGTGQQKSSKSFSDLLLSLAAGGRLVFSFESSGQGARR